MGIQNKGSNDRLHDAETAAELLGIRPSTIRWWWTIGKLPRVKIGRLTRVRESELLSLIGPEHRGRVYESPDRAIGGNDAPGEQRTTATAAKEDLHD